MEKATPLFMAAERINYVPIFFCRLFAQRRRGAISIAPVLLSLSGLWVSDVPARAADTEWTMINGNYEGTRYVQLKQIHRGNVAQLPEAFICPLNETTGFQSSPVVAGGRLFITTGTNTFAFNAGTGAAL